MTLLIVLAVVLTQSFAYAQSEREGIGIAPTSLTLTADPGQILNGQFTVVNAGSKPQRYKVYASEFKVRNEEYEKDFDTTPTVDSPATWFELPKEIQELPPDGQEVINYSIHVPQTALSQGYYGVIFAETLAGEPDTSGVARVKRVGSLVYLSVNGSLVTQGKLIGVETARWYKNQPVKANIRLQNDGNVHFPAKGNIVVKDVFGRKIQDAQFEGTIIPATIRKFSLELPMRRALGFYKLEGNVNLLGNDIPIKARWILIASPLWLLLTLLLVILWSIWLIRRVIKRGQHKSKQPE